MADLFDRFSGAAGALTAHTSDSGDTWTTYSGSVVALSGAGSLYLNTTFSDEPLSSWTPPSADYEASIVLGAQYAPASYSIGPSVRYSGATQLLKTGYYIQIFDTPLIMYITRVNSAVDTNLVNALVGVTPAAGDVVTLRVQGSGATVTVTGYYNGVQIVQFADSSASRITTADKVGIHMNIYGTPTSNQDIIRAIWAGAIGGPAQTVTPSTATVIWGATQGFTATGGLPNETLNWTATSGSASPSSGASTTYTAPGSGSSATVTWTSADLPTHTAAATVTLLSSGVATAFTLTGPAGGFNHNASTNFTFTPNGTYTGTITPTMSTLAGVWAPMSLSWSATATAQTATFTPSATGSGNANGTASPTLTAPANVAYTSNAQTLGVTPGALPASATTPEIFYGGGTFWLTSAPTFTPSGSVAGVSCGAVTVISNIEAHANVTTGTATGTFTWTDSTTGATALETVASIVNVLSIVQGLAPGLSTVGYAIYDEDGSLISAWTSIGVTERGTASGNYGATVAIPTGTFHEIRWSVSNAAPFFPDVVNLAAASSGTGGPVTLAASGVDAIVVETGINLRQAVSLALAALAGKASGLNANAPVFKGAGTNTTRITAATDPNGNRSTVTLTPPA